jgi:hypothetical protein
VQPSDLTFSNLDTHTSELILDESDLISSYDGVIDVVHAVDVQKSLVFGGMIVSHAARR